MITSITYGTIYGGKVKHIAKGADKTLCGRYVLLLGDTDAPVCKSCARIGGLVIEEELSKPKGDAWDMINGCESAHVHIDTPKLIAKKYTGFELSMWRDVLSDYANGAENDACWIGTLMLVLDRPNLMADGLKVSETTRRGGDGNVIDSTNAKRARTGDISEAQRNFIDSLQNQFDEMEELINGENAISCKIFTEEELSAFDKKRASKLIEALKAQIEKLKPAANAKRSEIRKAETKADPAEDGFYVMGDTFITVKWNRAKTGQYATVWNHECECWDYDGRKSYDLIKRIKANEFPRVSEADAIKFGELYGRCMRCSRTLTDPDSILAAMGSTCRGKMGF